MEAATLKLLCKYTRTKATSNLSWLKSSRGLTQNWHCSPHFPHSFTMRKGRFVCADPKEKWVTDLMRVIDQRNNKKHRKNVKVSVFTQIWSFPWPICRQTWRKFMKFSALKPMKSLINLMREHLSESSEQLALRCKKCKYVSDGELWNSCLPR